MNIVVGDIVYRVGFRYEPDWTPPTGLVHVAHPPRRCADGHWSAPYERVRRVKGRTTCRVSVVKRDTSCEHHARPVIVNGVVAPKPPCTCPVLAVHEVYAYCSLLDRFDNRRGRKQAFTRAMQPVTQSPLVSEAQQRETRRALWEGYLATVAVP